MALKGSPLARRFHKRLLGFVFLFGLFLTVLGISITHLYLVAGLKRSAMALDDLVNVQLDWMHRNAPLYTEGTEGVVNSIRQDGLAQRTPEMLFQHWGKTRGSTDNYRFSLISHWPLNPENTAQGEALTVLNTLEGEQKLNQERSWWSEGDAYYLMRPLAMRKDCVQCHAGHSDKKIRGAILWRMPTDHITRFRLRGGLIAIGLVLGSMIVLFLLVSRYFATTVTRPLDGLANLAEQISHGRFNAEFQYTHDDEIKQVEKGISRLKKSLQIAMRRLESNR